MVRPPVERVPRRHEPPRDTSPSGPIGRQAGAAEPARLTAAISRTTAGRAARLPAPDKAGRRATLWPPEPRRVKMV